MKKIKKDKSISLLFLCFFSLITINIFSQNTTFFKIGIVNDKYNYIKVHKEENGEIITKIIKGEYFFYKEQKGNWWLVKTLGGSQGIQGYVFKDSISKIDSRELLSVGIGANGGNNPDFLKDTIISYKSIEKNEDYRLGFLFKYNYPEIKRTIIRENNATFNQNGIIVKVITKKVNKDSFVSYGRHYTLPADSTYAVIPIGYADGLKKYLTKGGYVLINNHRCEIIGNICMDMTMVRIPKELEKTIKISDEVTVINADIIDNLNIPELCVWEFMTGIGRRVKRIIV